MSRRKRLDPKHVRDYFYRHALSVRIMTLIFDGIWWLICNGSTGMTRNIWRWIRDILPFRFTVNERQRRLHSFVVGRTGAGKSVLLHNLIRHYLTRNTQPTVILFDPHGDLARRVAHDRMNTIRDRLVYIRFSGIGRRQAHFNPFDLPNPTEVRLNHAQLQFSGAVEQIIGEPFTPRQRTLIRACLGVMLHRPNSTLVDLIRLQQDGQNADLLHYGQTKLPNVVDRQFFLGAFSDGDYRPTKHALVSRLTDIARDPVVRDFTCHPSSFDLAGLLSSGKVIVFQFDPSYQGHDTIRTLGQLLNAAIMSHVLGRPVHKRHPIHLFVDECQFFVSRAIADILGEGRKFGLYATLATQRLERLDADLQDAILGNVGNLWIGGSRSSTAEKLARETDIKLDKIRSLPNLQFFHVAPTGHTERRVLRYLGGRYAMKTRQWRDVLLDQSQRFYRRKSSSEQTLRKDEVGTGWKPDFL